MGSKKETLAPVSRKGLRKVFQGQRREYMTGLEGLQA